MEFIIYDECFSALGIIDVFESCRWSVNFYSGGAFEIVLPASKYYKRLIQKHRYILRSDVNEMGFITSIIEQVSKSTKLIVVSGSMISALFDKRFVKIDDKDGISLSTALKQCGGYPFRYLNIDVADDDKYIIPKDNNLGNLGNAVRELLRNDKKAVRIQFNAKEFVMLCTIAEAADRSVSQSINHHVIFSVESGELAEMQYQYSEVDCYNHITGYAIYPNIEEPIKVDASKEYMRTWVEIQEGYSDALSISTAAFETEAIYYYAYTEDGTKIAVINYELTQKKLINLCREQLIKYSENYSCIAVDSNYRSNWNVGDIVTLFDSARDVYIDKQIEEVSEYFEASGKSIDIIFGEPLRTLYDLAKEGKN